MAEVERAFKESEDGGVAQFPALLDQLLEKVQTLDEKTKDSVQSEVSLNPNLQ